MGEPERQRQPRGRRVEVEIADVSQEEVREGEREAPEESCGATQPQPTQKSEHCHGGEPDVEEGQALHHRVGWGAKDSEGQKVERVEQAGLIVSDERGTAVEMWIPQWDGA
jgi:hypothetical protein